MYYMYPSIYVAEIDMINSICFARVQTIPLQLPRKRSLTTPQKSPHITSSHCLPGCNYQADLLLIKHSSHCDVTFPVARTDRTIS